MSPFLAWGDFHARSRFAHSTIPEEKWGTTRSLCESRRQHLVMTCDIFGTGQTNTLTLCYLLGKTYKPAHSSAALESLKLTRSTKLLEKLLT